MSLQMIIKVWFVWLVGVFFKMELLFVQRAVHAEEGISLCACVLSFNCTESAVCIVW